MGQRSYSLSWASTFRGRLALSFCTLIVSHFKGFVKRFFELFCSVGRFCFTSPNYALGRGCSLLSASLHPYCITTWVICQGASVGTFVRGHRPSFTPLDIDIIPHLIRFVNTFSKKIFWWAPGQVPGVRSQVPVIERPGKSQARVHTLAINHFLILVESPLILTFALPVLLSLSM